MGNTPARSRDAVLLAFGIAAAMQVIGGGITDLRSLRRQEGCYLETSMLGKCNRCLCQNCVTYPPRLENDRHRRAERLGSFSSTTYSTFHEQPPLGIPRRVVRIAVTVPCSTESNHASDDKKDVSPNQRGKR